MKPKSRLTLACEMDFRELEYYRTIRLHSEEEIEDFFEWLEFRERHPVLSKIALKLSPVVVEILGLLGYGRLP